MSTEFFRKRSPACRNRGHWSARRLGPQQDFMLSDPASVSSPRHSTAVLLANGINRLEVTLKLTTAILALAAGVYTYLGVRELLNGSPTTVFFAAVMYSVAVSVGIYAFWVFMMHFMPHVTSRGGRSMMF